MLLTDSMDAARDRLHHTGLAGDGCRLPTQSQ